MFVPKQQYTPAQVQEMDRLSREMFWDGLITGVLYTLFCGCVVAIYLLVR